MTLARTRRRTEDCEPVGENGDADERENNLSSPRRTLQKEFEGIFSYTPELHVAFCPIFVHPLLPVFEPHILKWVIFVRRRPCVCDTLRFESPLLRGKKSNLAPTPSSSLARTTTIELPECQERRGAKTILVRVF